MPGMHVWLFDIDGTLIDTHRAGRRAFEAAIAQQFGLDGIKGRVPFSGRTDRAIAGDLFRGHGIADSDENWQKFFEVYLSQLESFLSLGEGQVLPGVVALLDTLAQRRDCKLGLLTGNVERGARLKLGQYGLSERFAFGGFGDRHVDRNDVARCATLAAEEVLGVNASQVQFHVIGDTPADVECARAVDATAVAVATGKYSVDQLASSGPDVLVENLRDDAWVANLLGSD
jgi:phosphoglycolate phosphatase